MICGIDCGVNGALALFGDDGALLQAVDMPSTSVRVGKTQRNRINGPALAALLREWKPSHAAVERVSPRGGPVKHPDGKRGGDTPMTAGALMQAAGTVDGVLAGLAIPVSYVETKEWRKSAGIKTHPGMDYDDRKEASRQWALQRYPAKAELFRFKLHADRAEAAAIGRWLLARGDFA